MKDNYIRQIVVNRVVDGDTVDVNIDLGFDTWTKQRLRLLGIDAPETRTKDLDEKEKGLKAKAWLETRLAIAKQEDKYISIQSEKTGKYGRYLATLYIDGVNINREMLEKGLAEIYGS